MTLTVHHLQVSQSERIVWLCEELDVPYNLEIYQRCPARAPPEYKALHPQGTAPVITDGDLTLAESGAIMEYICHKYADGKLFLPPNHPNYTDFLYWWHWANASFFSNLVLLRAGGDPLYTGSAEERFKKALRMLDDRLLGNKWLAGEDFTVADIMIVFAFTTMRHAFPYNLEGYPNIVNYLGHIGGRESYRNAMAKSDPGLELPLGPSPPKTGAVQGVPQRSSIDQDS
ncbi:hypothetical protein ACHAPJ_007484 [Fusarium lateritium]